MRGKDRDHPKSSCKMLLQKREKSRANRNLTKHEPVGHNFTSNTNKRSIGIKGELHWSIKLHHRLLVRCIGKRKKALKTKIVVVYSSKATFELINRVTSK